MDIWSIVGGLAAFCIAVQWLPEIRQGWKSKSLKDFSWFTLFFSISGAALFTAYGLHIDDIFVWGLNVFVGLCLLLIAGMKFSFESKKKK